jgi:hypothetical protein
MSPVRVKLKGLLALSPGGLEAALAVKHALFPPPPGGEPGKMLVHGLRDLERLRPAGPGDERRLLMFACRDPWLRVSLASAVVLLARLCRIDFAYLPHTGVSRDDSTVESKEFRFYYSRFFRESRHPRLRFFDLTRLTAAPPSAAFEREAEQQSLLDTKWVLQREEIDPPRNERHRAVFQFRRRRNLDCMLRLVPLLEQSQYDAVLIPHGNLRELGAAYRAARLLGRRVISFDFKDRAEAVVLSDDGPVSDMDTSHEWALDAPHVLSASARTRLQDLMTERQGTVWRRFTWAPQRAPYQGGSRPAAGGRTALLCPNVAWDSALLGRDRAFPSLVEWVRQTVRYFAARRDCRLIVRVHPAEAIFGTGQPVAGVVRECCHPLPDHIRVVGPTDPVNTYDLMDACDFGLVYNSTAGLEMAMRGLPTIVAGRPHYAGKGFTIEPRDPVEYRSVLDRMLYAPSRLSAREVDLAWCYADVFFFRWHRPFPWCMRNFCQHLARWPFERVLSGQGWELFGPTFDLLAGRRV